MKINDNNTYREMTSDEIEQLPNINKHKPSNNNDIEIIKNDIKDIKTMLLSLIKKGAQ